VEWDYATISQDTSKYFSKTHMIAQNQSEKIETAESAKLNPVMLLCALQVPPSTAFQFIAIGVQWKNSYIVVEAMTHATAAIIAYIDHSYTFLPLAMRSKVKQMAHLTGMAARQNMVCMMNLCEVNYCRACSL